MLESISGGAPAAPSSEFEVGFAGEPGTQTRVGLADATLLAFEMATPVPLTTKEGWRRFVDAQPEPPSDLTPAQVLALPPRARADHDEARRDYHVQSPLVNSPTTPAAPNTGRLRAQLNRRQVPARRGLFSSGASGTGKTAALPQLGRVHERAVRPAGTTPPGRAEVPA